MQKRIIIWGVSSPGSIGKSILHNKPLRKEINEEIKRQQKIEKSYNELRAALPIKLQTTKKKLKKI